MISNFRAPCAVASVGQHNRILSVWIVEANTKMHGNIMGISLATLKINSESVCSIDTLLKIKLNVAQIEFKLPSTMWVNIAQYLNYFTWIGSMQWE